MMDPKEKTQVASYQRGQAAVLAALSLFTMVVFLAMATNAGILVNDRIRMQNTADLTSYAGAFEQARQLNKMAIVNRQIYDTVQELRAVLNYGPTYDENDPPPDTYVYYWPQPPCSCWDYSPAAEQVISRYQDEIDGLVARLDNINAAAQERTRYAATYTASKNFLGTYTRPNHLSFFDYVPNSPTNDDNLVYLSQVSDTTVGYNYTRSCRCCDRCCLYPQIKTEDIQTWEYKGNNAIVYFPAKVKGVPAKNFLDIGQTSKRYFGADADPNPSASDMLYGYAVSKPFEGIVGTDKNDNEYYESGPEYPNRFTPMNPVYPPSDALVDYFRPQYRARVAAIHDDMGDNLSMSDLIASDVQEPQFTTKTQYFTH